ncbi:alginate export family protein [Salegentibacter salegens]|uniref:Alginate export n=1 Tax=Salegentibacter salegens TaxID=143223 RepID=A0A1M7NS18_9FLAO|nr:alginate export family protein [Salegentibacter salegens]PRX42439.1 alginate export protein [Salegentibacter salegens]SHN06866.1 Alginate export [Salegentibacter salegens]
MNFKLPFLFFSLFLLYPISGISQNFYIDADIRPRFEYRHGYGNLFPNDAKPAAFVTQRSRLNLDYNSEKLQTYISIQDVSTWGDTRQILPSDHNDSFSLFQAWAQLQLSDYFAVKLGRQVISYDDQRIFGGLDWAMQGRSHDALILKYKSTGLTIDLGAAYNQEEPYLTGNTYAIQGFFSYKSMQYFYLKKELGSAQFSILFLNNGFQKFAGENNDQPDGVYNRQTTGSYFRIPAKRFQISGSAYYQFGYSSAQQELSAYQFSLLGEYKLNNMQYGIGLEILSGTDRESEGINKSFFPLYGTNHKFNGFMDYFYVGNHANSVGLNDFHGKININTGKLNSLLIKAHYFTSNASLGEDHEKYLGTELDAVFTHKFSKDIILNLGYSHMFASENMGILKSENHQNTNNWAWAQLTISPRIFQHNFTKD